MNKRILRVAIAFTALVLWLTMPIAHAQQPTGPTTALKSTFAVASPPSQFEVVQDVIDFPPGSWTPPHVHGGPAFISVVQGQLTYRAGGEEKSFKAGETWTELPSQVNQTGNPTSSPARTLVTFLLPIGAQVTTAQQVAGAQVSTAPRPQISETKFATANPPSQFDLVEVQLDFAPGAVMPSHTHGGPAYITVLSGQVTARLNGTEKTYQAGGSWSENPGEFFQVSNTGTSAASTFVTFLLPKGAPLTTFQQQETPSTSTASAPIWLVASIVVLVLIVLAGGVLLARRKITPG